MKLHRPTACYFTNYLWVVIFDLTLFQKEPLKVFYKKTVLKVFYRKWASKTPKPQKNVKTISSLNAWGAIFKNTDFC